MFMTIEEAIELSNQGRRFTESEVRSIVGAPTQQEEETCMCGELLAKCPDAYDHMSHGF